MSTSFVPPWSNYALVLSCFSRRLRRKCRVVQRRRVKGFCREGVITKGNGEDTDDVHHLNLQC